MAAGTEAVDLQTLGALLTGAILVGGSVWQGATKIANQFAEVKSSTQEAHADLSLKIAELHGILSTHVAEDNAVAARVDKAEERLDRWDDWMQTGQFPRLVK